MDCVPLGPIEAVFRGTKNHISDLTSQDEHISASLENILGSSSISWIIFFFKSVVGTAPAGQLFG